MTARLIIGIAKASKTAAHLAVLLHFMHCIADCVPVLPKQVKGLLAPQRSWWRSAVKTVGGRWGLRAFSIPDNWQEPASLDYVYDDDEANMPIHYIAAGAPVSM